MTNVAEFISSDELRRLGYTAVYDGGREQWARLRWSVRTEEYRVLFYRNATEVKTESYVRLKNARAAARSWAGVTDDGTREE